MRNQFISMHHLNCYYNIWLNESTHIPPNDLQHLPQNTTFVGSNLGNELSLINGIKINAKANEYVNVIFNTKYLLQLMCHAKCVHKIRNLRIKVENQGVNSIKLI